MARHSHLPSHPHPGWWGLSGWSYSQRTPEGGSGRSSSSWGCLDGQFYRIHSKWHHPGWMEVPGSGRIPLWGAESGSWFCWLSSGTPTFKHLARVAIRLPKICVSSLSGHDTAKSFGTPDPYIEIEPVPTFIPMTSPRRQWRITPTWGGGSKAGKFLLVRPYSDRTSLCIDHQDYRPG